MSLASKGYRSSKDEYFKMLYKSLTHKKPYQFTFKGFVTSLSYICGPKVHFLRCLVPSLWETSILQIILFMVGGVRREDTHKQTFLLIHTIRTLLKINFLKGFCGESLCVIAALLSLANHCIFFFRMEDIRGNFQVLPLISRMVPSINPIRKTNVYTQQLKEHAS